MADVKYIKKIELNNGTVGYIYDSGAPRKEDLLNYLPKSGGVITGNLTIDNDLISGKLTVTSIEYIPQDTEYDILVVDASGDVHKKSTSNLLKDIGGCSYSINDSDGTLSFTLGKQ